MKKGILIYLVLLIGCGSPHMRAGKIYLDQEEYEKAIEQFKLQLKEKPNDAEAWWLLGITYKWQKKYEEACECIDKAIEIEPKRIEERKLFLWALYSSAGFSLMKKKEWELAKKRLIQAINFEPDSVYSYLDLARVYIVLGKEDSGAIYYKKAIKVNPNHIEAYRELGIYYMRQKQYDEAIEYLKAASTIKPNNADIAYRLGIAYYYKKDYSKAEKAFENAIKYDSTFTDAYLNLGTTLTKKKEYDKAIEMFKKVIELNPKDEEAHLNLGSAYYHIENYELAVEAYTKAIELDSLDSEGYQGRAGAYWKLGKKKEAEADLQKVKELK
jgi:tetratricopeptide (TPR) repeat protein